MRTQESPELVVQTGHTRAVVYLAVSPDGGTLASGGIDGARLWDTTGGFQEMLLAGRAWEFTMGGRWLYPFADPAESAVDLERRGPITLPRHHGPLAISPDGARIVTDGGGFARVYENDLSTPRLTLTDRSLGGGREYASKDLNHISITPDSRLLLKRGADDGYFFLWDLSTGTLVQTLFVVPRMETAIAPDGTCFVGIGGGGREVRIYDLPDGRLRSRVPLKHALGPIHAVRWFPDSRHVAVAAGKAVWVLDPFRGSVVRRFDRKTKALAIAPDGATLYVADTDGTTVLRIDAVTGATVRRFAARAAPGAAVRFAGDDLLLGQGLVFARWRLGERQPTVRRLHKPLTLPPTRYRSIDQEQCIVALAPDGRRLLARIGVSHPQDRGYPYRLVLVLVDTATGKVARRLAQESPFGMGPFAPTRVQAAFSNDGTRLALTRPAERVVEVQEVATGRILWRRTAAQAGRPDAYPEAIAFTADGMRVVVSWSQGEGKFHPTIALRHEVDAFEIATGQRVGGCTVIGSERNWAHLGLTPDGRTLIAHRWVQVGRQELCTWDLASGEAQPLPNGAPYDKCETLVVRPDAQVLAIASWAGKRIGFWDLQARRMIGEILPGIGNINALAFRGDGEVLASASDDGSVRLWKVPSP